MGTPSRPARAVLGERTTNAVNTAIPSSTLSNTATFQPPVIVRLHPVRPVSHSPNVLQPPRSPPTSKQNENRPPTHSPQQPYYTDTAHKAALQASLSPVKHSAVRRSSHHSSPYALPVGGDEDSVSDNRRLSFNRPTERVLHIHSIDDRESLARLSEGPPAVQAPAPSFRYSLRSSYRPYQWTANKSAVSGRPSFANYYAPPVPAELSPALPPSPSSQHESPVELLTEPESPPAPTQHLTASEHGSLHKRQLSSHKRPLPPRHVPRSAGAFNTAVSQSPLLSPAIGRSPSSAPRPLPYYRPPSLASVTPALPSAPHNKEDDSEQKDVQPQADSSHWQSSSRSLSSSVAAVEAANDVHLSLGIGSAASMSFQTFVGSNEYGMYEREVVNNVDLLRRSNALNDETADYCLLLEPDRQEQAVDEQQQQQQQQQPADEVEMYIRQIECQNSNTLTDALDPEAALKTPDRRAAVAAAVSPTSPSSPTSAPKRRQQLNSPLPTFLFSDLSRRFSSHYQLQAGQSNSAYITQRLLDAGLSVKEDRLRLGGKVLLCVGASAGRLEAEAEKMKLRLRVKGGGWSKFDRTMRDQFVGSGDAADMFRSSERQIIIDHIIRTKQAEGGAGLDDKYASIIADRFPLHMYARLQSLQPWLRYWQLQRHSKSRLPSISSLLSQPLDAISAYFGEGVAFYFAFLGFYTLWLLVPTVLGAVLFVSQLSHTSLDSPLVPFFCVLMSLWASFFIEYWRRRQAVLSNRWGTWQLAANDEELMRPEYRGALKRHEVTGELTREYPLRKRVKKVSVAVLLCFVIVAGFSTLILNLFVQQDKYFGTDTTDSTSSFFSLDMLFTPIVWGLLIPLSELIFNVVARKITDWENWRTHSLYDKTLIVKIFSFRFLNSFLALYYYAFADLGILRLSTSVASFLIIGSAFRFFIYTVCPTLYRKAVDKVTQRKGSKAIRDGLAAEAAAEAANSAADEEAGSVHRRHKPLSVSHSWVESAHLQYDTFEDYCALVIQFGYVSFFTVAFPLAPLCALLTNIVEIRAGAYKLLHVFRRPLAVRATGIGVWLTVLQVMSITAVLTNCALIGFTSQQVDNWVPNVSSGTKILIIFVFEHVVIAVKYIIHSCMLSVPREVRVAEQKEKLDADKRHIQWQALKQREMQQQQLYQADNDAKRYELS